MVIEYIQHHDAILLFLVLVSGLEALAVPCQALNHHRLLYVGVALHLHIFLYLSNHVMCFQRHGKDIRGAVSFLLGRHQTEKPYLCAVRGKLLLE